MLGFGALGEFALGQGPTEGQPFNNISYSPTPPFRIRKSPFDLSVSLNPNLFKNNVPFLNHFESSFHWLIFTPPSNPYNQNLYTIIVGSIPFNQTDWAKTVRLRGAFDHTHAFNPNLQTNPFPFNQTDWLKPTRSPRTSIQPPDTLNPNLYTNAFPFNQYDWARPIRIAGFDELPAIGINPNVFTNLLPFSTLVLPLSIQRAFTSTTPIFNPNLSVVVTIVPILNFASTITYRFRISLPDNSTGFLITRPITPPPTTTLIQRTLTGVGL